MFVLIYVSISFFGVFRLNYYLSIHIQSKYFYFGQQYFPFRKINIPHFCFFTCIVHFETVRSVFALILWNNRILYISAVSLMNYEITGWRRLLLSNNNINIEKRYFTFSSHVRSTRYTEMVLIKYKWRQDTFKGFTFLKTLISLYFKISARHLKLTM